MNNLFFEILQWILGKTKYEIKMKGITKKKRV